MTAEYINRAELIENLNKFAPEHYNALINQLITKQPTADVVKVKHADWRSVVDDVIFACSNCDAEVSTSWDYENDDMFDYCPCCGAKMDGTPKERGGEK